MGHLAVELSRIVLFASGKLALAFILILRGETIETSLDGNP